MTGNAGSSDTLEPFIGFAREGTYLREKGREATPAGCRERRAEESQETVSRQGTEMHPVSEGGHGVAETRCETESSPNGQTSRDSQVRQEREGPMETQPLRPEMQRIASGPLNMEAASSIAAETAPPSYEQALLERRR